MNQKETEALVKRIAELKAENERLKREVQHYKNIAFNAQTDAELYRWLRDKHNDWHSSWRVYKPHKTLGSIAVDTGLSESLDEVIEEAMKNE